ncbi:trehalose-6-phosphate synthase [Oxalobacteraceae bacterium A2-2]
MLSRSVKLSLRFILPLAVLLGLFAYIVVPLMDKLTLRWSVRDLDNRSQLLASTLQVPLREYVLTRDKEKIKNLFDNAIQDERLFGLGFCDPSGKLLYKTYSYPQSLGCWNAPADGSERKSLVQLPRGPVHVAESEVTDDPATAGVGAAPIGRLILVHDMSFIERRSAETKKYVLGFFALLGLAIAFLTLVVSHLSWRGWLAGLNDILRGELLPRAATDKPADNSPPPPEMEPLIGELRGLLEEYHQERQSSAGGGTADWTPDKLKVLLQQDLAGDQVLVVSNREPYIHEKTADGVKVRRPASGLVTAVEAVMRACSGTWIAHGAGSADRETVDRNDHVPVPPKNPSYTLRRVWLTKEEEKGYYYGFANEGLWPLCHIAHVRPVFRSSDWEEYVKVNRRFADAVIREARTDNPVVLVQDYHFALLPRMVREALPKATIITFWHIPWPNSESFGICPWREEILEGMLGSTILGFHTPFHRKNFLDTVDRYLETRIEPEASTISYGGDLTQVEDYPISIAWPDYPDTQPVEQCRSEIRQLLGVPEDHLLGFGVDRLDYTKGILERFQAVERMLELHPSMVGKFSFVQIAAPSRSDLEEYMNFDERVRRLADRINQRFADAPYPPIMLKIEHHEQNDLQRYFRASEVCMVTSLHDGMNLVAKEYIAARDDERGALVLSQFTGAARELHEALIINPYHIEQGAEALYRGLTMPPVEQRERMRSMRDRVRLFNVYRWAGHMLLDAARLRKREKVMQKIRSHSRGHLRRVG